MARRQNAKSVRVQNVGRASQKTVSQIFDLVLGQAADRSGARSNQLNDGKGVKDSDASTVKIRDDKNIGARLDETVKLGGKIALKPTSET